MFETLQQQILSHLQPRRAADDADDASSKLRATLGETWVESLRGTIVADFGCGHGAECEELAAVASRVIGVDIEENARRIASRRTAHLPNVTIVDKLREPVDAIISIDAFEHFSDPAAILRVMAGSLKPGGRILTSFGPTWYHPNGGHLFSIFPWSHLVFSERALCEWRKDFRNDSAASFSEVEGGLNRMTIGRAEQLFRDSGLEIEEFETVPIRPLRWAHTNLTREFTSSVVKAILVKP